MAGSSFFMLLDDIAAVLDDVATMTKIATKKSAGLLGDDLALNAEQVTGTSPERELAVVWAVFKGSAINKVIIVPVALGLSALAPWVITPLLMLGGSFLCFEGGEKLTHKFLHPNDNHVEEHKKAVANVEVDLVQLEKDKIKGAVRTDFILSAEIIVISLGAMTTATFGTRVAALSAIATLVTVGVYGLVAGIVKVDDAGLALARKDSSAARAFGRSLLWFAPKFMKTLSIVGTIAMFLVGGGILAHGIGPIHHFVQNLAAKAGGASFFVSMLADGIVGLVAGALLVLIITPIMKLFKKEAPKAEA